MRSRRRVLPSSCRHDSLDSLQHLSGDGFIRSWLPSYANYSKVCTVPPCLPDPSPESLTDPLPPLLWAQPA